MARFFKMSSMNIEEYIQTLKNGSCLPERDLRMVCERVKEILIEESNV